MLTGLGGICAALSTHHVNFPLLHVELLRVEAELILLVLAGLNHVTRLVLSKGLQSRRLCGPGTITKYGVTGVSD